ncbi:MAG: type IV pilus biogenesis/stability protein PilW [Gammaproteobacteria bacterium]
MRIPIKFLLLFLVFSLFVACATGVLPSRDEGSEDREADTVSPNLQLGLGYIHIGNNVRAKQKLLAAIEQAPHSPEANGAMAYYAETTGDIELAEAYYQKALRYSGGEGAPFNNYGVFLCRQGNYQQAQQYFNTALQDQNYLNVAGIYENAGICAMLTSDFKQAEEYFIKSINHDSKRPTSLLQLAELRYQQKKYQQAHSYLQAYEKTASLTAKSAWLGYNIAMKNNSSENLGSYAFVLSEEFPDSREYLLLSAGESI